MAENRSQTHRKVKTGGWYFLSTPSPVWPSSLKRVSSSIKWTEKHLSSHGNSAPGTQAQPDSFWLPVLIVRLGRNTRERAQTGHWSQLMNRAVDTAIWTGLGCCTREPPATVPYQTPSSQPSGRGPQWSALLEELLAVDGITFPGGCGLR